MPGEPLASRSIMGEGSSTGSVTGGEKESRMQTRQPPYTMGPQLHRGYSRSLLLQTPCITQARGPRSEGLILEKGRLQPSELERDKKN